MVDTNKETVECCECHNEVLLEETFPVAKPLEWFCESEFNEFICFDCINNSAQNSLNEYFGVFEL